MEFSFNRLNLYFTQPARTDMDTLIPAHLADHSLLLCHYKNATSQLQVLRISNIDEWYFERVVFPGQEMMFEAPATADLEVYQGKVKALVSERLSCQSLQVEQSEASLN
jgi:hypothetical protein